MRQPQISSRPRLLDVVSECVWNNVQMLIVHVKFPRLTCMRQNDLGLVAVLLLRPDGWTAAARQPAGRRLCVPLICLHTHTHHTNTQLRSSAAALTQAPVPRNENAEEEEELEGSSSNPNSNCSLVSVQRAASIARRSEWAAAKWRRRFSNQHGEITAAWFNWKCHCGAKPQAHLPPLPGTWLIRQAPEEAAGLPNVNTAYPRTHAPHQTLTSALWGGWTHRELRSGPVPAFSVDPWQKLLAEGQDWRRDKSLGLTLKLSD